ncbi:hypothetical protein CANARDRAFT_185053, partial [[Candida] arabinofermentans NRRL YB-2248]
MSQKSLILKSYREALRATHLAFRNDLQTLSAARSTIKNKMKLKVDPEQPEWDLNQRLLHLDGVSTFLKRNIVQEMEVVEDRWFLNIHNETELGDNDTI